MQRAKTSLSVAVLVLFCFLSLLGCSSSGSDGAHVPPVAHAGTSQNVTTGTVVMLDGKSSSDPNGDSLTFLWTFVSRPSGSTATLSAPTTVNPTFLADLAGTYIMSLVVTTRNGASAPATVTVRATTAPRANAGPDQSVPLGTVVTLDGKSSSDPNGDSLTFLWTFVSRPSSSTATLSAPTTVNPTFTADLPGSYVVRLVVNDGTVDSTSDTVTISADDHGQTENTATVVNVNSQTAGVLDSGQDADVFRITLPSAGTLTVETTGTTDTGGILIPSLTGCPVTGSIALAINQCNAARLAVDDDSGVDLNFRIVATLQAGTYFVIVETVRVVDRGGYTFISSFTPTARALASRAVTVGHTGDWEETCGRPEREATKCEFPGSEK